ncbi:MAG: Bax inhibitor-1/YccA family protein, partial [Gammaproteobacteria bacterium]
LDGAVNKTAIMLAVLVSTATISWNFSGPLIDLVTLVGIFAAVVSSFITFGLWIPFIGFIVNPRPYLAPRTWLIFAAGEGFLIGSISLTFETMFPGIVLEAVSLTFCVAATLLFLYKSGLVKPSQNFVLMLCSAIFGIMLFYIGAFIYTLVTGTSPEILSGSSNFSIGLSLFVVGLAALSLVLDFDIIEQSAERGAPKYMEYFGAMALVTTLIWLYIEILRLLAKFRSR